MTAPRRPVGMKAKDIPVRSVRITDDLYDAARNKARELDPPRTVSNVLLTLLTGWVDNSIKLPGQK